MGIQKEKINGEDAKFRSKRQRKRAAIEEREKQLLRFYREHEVLMTRKRELPMIDLVPPIQKGWKRYFVVREDVRRSRDGGLYEAILQKINTFQYSPEKVFRKKKRRLGKKVYVEIKQELKLVYPHELARLKLTERELSCFDYRAITILKGRRIDRTYAYVFKEPWRYVLRIRPNMIDKAKVHDSVLEQRIHELEDILFNDYENLGTLKKLKGWRNYRWYIDTKYKNPLKNKPIYRIIEEAID